MGDTRRPFQIGGPAVASLLVNGLLIGALFNLGMDHVSRTDSPALTVMSLAALKGVNDGDEEAKAAEPSVSTAAATPSPPVEPVPDEPPPPMVQPAPPNPPAPPVPLPSMQAIGEHPSAEQPRQPMPSAPQAAAQSSPAAPPARRGIADGLDASAPPGTSRSYAAKVRSWLYAHKLYPRRARMRHEEGRVRVRFVIDRSGILIEGAIVQGSGNSTLDEEAMAMMQRASPFPKAPEDVPGERIEFIAPIEFSLPA